MSSSDSYILKYFNARGRGELTRLVFAAGGLQYEDCRINQQDWPAEKAKTKFGQLPVLLVNGKQYTQGGAIANYIAKKCKLYGKNDEEALQIDEVQGVVQDIVYCFTRTYFEKDEEKKKALQEENDTVTLPKFLGFLEKLLSENPEGGDYYVGSTLTLADLAVFDILDEGRIKPEVYSKFPKVTANRERVASNPAIAKWLKERPKTQF